MKSKDHAGVWVPPPILFALPLLAAVMLHAGTPWPLSRGHETALAIGALFAIATGITIGLASVFRFRHANTTILPAGRSTSIIVDRGPYRFTRNPMYLGMALVYLGVALVNNNAWAIVLLPAVLTVVDVFVIRREERYLAAKFGHAYRDYCSRVRRWF
jgi:protein-S-isoprenylcysteine O-methyltransferase Ste14